MIYLLFLTKTYYLNQYICRKIKMSKKYYYITFFIFSTIFIFLGCKNDDESQDTEWKDKNEAFFNKLGDRNELTRIYAESGHGLKNGCNFIYYKVLKSGPKDQLSPIYTDNVSVHYTGATLAGFNESEDTIIAGKEFDTSYNDRNCISPGVYKPASFKLSGVIEGWWVALQKMKPGDKWQVYIPCPLGYKESGSGTAIPGYSTLIFEIELVSVN